MPIIDSKNLYKTGKITIDVEEIRDEIKGTYSTNLINVFILWDIVLLIC